MKRCMLLVALLCMVGFASPVLYRKAISKPVSISYTPTVILSDTFQVSDTTCCVQVNVYGSCSGGSFWVELDDRDTLLALGNSGNAGYADSIPPGMHILQLTAEAYTSPAHVYSAYLQILVFEPDKQNEVLEKTVTMVPTIPKSELTTSSFIFMNDAQEVIDITGRTIPNVISKDRVYFSDLPRGIYYVKTGSTIVKVVKM